MIPKLEMKILLYFVFSILVQTSLQDKSITFQPNIIKLEKNITTLVKAQTTKTVFENQTYVFNYAYGESAISYKEDQEIIVPLPNKTICGNETSFSFEVTSEEVGSILVGASVLYNNSYKLLDGYFKVTVVHYQWLEILQVIVGWVYFFAWSISFYPQIIRNFVKKSVVGMSFDYCFLNFIGFLSYTTFNVSLFWIPQIQHEYHLIHPRGKIPVEPNDVAFCLNSLLATIITVIQTFIYEKQQQTISKIGRIIMSLIALVMLITCFLAVGNVISWLTFVNIFSLVKLLITTIKYFPQAWMNFTRKSTEGWCIGNVICDFIGGFFSFLQMILIASNNNDWTIIYGNVTKLGLGIFSIMFDVLFFIQHCIYKKGYEIITCEDI